MEDIIKAIHYHGFDINIYYDDIAESPDCWGDDELFLTHYHRQFEITRDELITQDELTDYYNGEKIDKQKVYHIFMVYAYIHSGVSLSLADVEYPFTDKWDTSCCGAVMVEKYKGLTKSKARKMANGLIKSWNEYLSGEIYGYSIEGIDSCYGYYGDIETSGLLDEAKGAIDYHIDKATKKHIKARKAQMKNKVELQKRVTLIDTLYHLA